MDLRVVEKVSEEKGLTTPNLGGGGDQHTHDPNRALQSFLDHIPVSSIPGIRSHSTVLELKPDDCVRDAIRMLYDENVSGAPVVDNMSSRAEKLAERDIGFVEFSSMVLWSLEEIDKVKSESKGNTRGYFSLLEEISEIGQTRIADLAKSFLWEPFFPVRAEDTLFHVLLLFSKHHRLKVVPVIESSDSCVIGFVAQSSVVQSLLQCRGLEWFDQIAQKPLSEFGFEHSGSFAHVYADQTLADTFHILWEKQIGGAPIIDRKNGALCGSVKCSDVHLLLEDDHLFNNRKSLGIEALSRVVSGRSYQRTNLSKEGEVGVLCLKDNSLPPLNALTTNRTSDSLKQAMESMMASKSERSFLVSESGQLEGVVTLRDVISQFSPPSMDSTIDGGGFFNSALEQTGCHVEDGSIIRNA